MSTPTPTAGHSDEIPSEFTRILDQRHVDGTPLHIEASPQECARLAQRFLLVRVDALSADVRLTKDDTAVVATGRLSARIVQSCAISAEDLPVTIDEPLALRFVKPQDLSAGFDEEIELTDADCDEIPFDGERFDLGEAVAQSLALAIDPYAEGPGAAKVRASGLLGEENLSPFAALAGLKLPEA
jgi:uncharacterized metal-binding protein YceD (DUF177 family)